MEKATVFGGVLIVVIGFFLTKAGSWQFGIPAMLFGVISIGYGVINLFKAA